MKIAIDVSPLSSGHKFRGVGFYLTNLKEALMTYFPQNNYLFFTDLLEIPSDFKIVHFPYFEPFFPSLPTLASKKTVVTVHDLTPIVFKSHFPSGLKGSLRWQFQKRKLKNVDAIITDSYSSKEDIKKIVGIPDKKISVTYLAASNDFSPINSDQEKNKIKKKFKLPDNFLLYVGDVTWNKNLPAIVSAVKKTNKTLVMVGKALVDTHFDKSNPWNKDLIKIHSEIDNDNRFLSLGFVSNSELNMLYNCASGLIMASIYEGFGLPVLEAMQAGCAVVSSSGGSLREVVKDSAILVNERSIDSISEGILKLDDRELTQTYIKKGFSRASEFSWKKTAEETIGVYKMLDK